MASEDTDLSGWEAAGDALTADGIATLPHLFAEEADYLYEAYIEEIIEPRIPRSGITHVAPDRAAATGSPCWKYISAADPVLAHIVLHPGLLGIIARYYGTQPYLRRMPFVKRTQIQPHHIADIASVYHIDQGKHFVSIMMLLSDLTDRDSHMRFLKGTHRIEQSSFRLEPADPRNREVDITMESKYPVFNLVGPKGTIFVYDNGNGIHKGNMIAGTTRNVMQTTYSRGDHVTKPSDLDLMPTALKACVAESPALVRNAITRIA